MTDACPKVTRERLANRRAHTLLNIEAGGFRYVAGVGHYQDGRLAEIFLTAAKGGTAIDDAARDSAVVASIALQHGVEHVDQTTREPSFANAMPLVGSAALPGTREADEPSSGNCHSSTRCVARNFAKRISRNYRKYDRLDRWRTDDE